MSDETNVDAGATNDTGTASSDPLDLITDPEELRQKAKGYRAERNRFKDRPAEPVAPVTATALQKPVTYGDVLKQNERKGFDLIKDNEDIVAHKDQILTFLNTNYGTTVPEPEEIAERWKDAHAAFRRRNPIKDESNPGAELQTDTGVKGRGQSPSAEKVPEKKPIPGWDKDVGPDSWYPKKG